MSIRSTDPVDLPVDPAQRRPDGFDVPLGAAPAGPDPVGPGHWLVQTDGQVAPLPVWRWHGAPEPAVEPVVSRCTGPTIDLGCGPGRLAAALARRGAVALGVDISAEAVRLARLRGVSALRRDLFDPLPGEGRWAHALLIDGNIGIGGDPVRLLRRCGALLRAGGTVLVELDPPGTGLWRGQAHVASDVPGQDGPHTGPVFHWARLGVEAVDAVAAGAGLRVVETFRSGSRRFAELVRG
ncbi:methyltransferase domain-containing protein [Plantactinospora sp. B24E8]|uniref:methyltransferase domain-containing protein n=1 Tax=Plantactinospora sp. B24E8 TaxID=3153567 RepID=UPI00325D124D